MRTNNFKLNMPENIITLKYPNITNNLIAIFFIMFGLIGLLYKGKILTKGKIHPQAKKHRFTIKQKFKKKKKKGGLD